MKDSEIVTYIAKGMKHEFIRLSKKNCLVMNSETPLTEEIQIIDNSYEEQIELSIAIKEAIYSLTDLQKEVIIKSILLDKKEKDIADELHTSRQAVNRTKSRALKRLKEKLKDWY